mgnify:CR=1 FL=1
MGKLTATAVKQAKSIQAAFKMSDGGGLYLLVPPVGRKCWRYDYRFAGKRKTLAIGVYPDVSLLDARKRHQSAREQLAMKRDPAELKKIEKLGVNAASAASFEAVGRDWFQHKMNGKSDSYRTRTLRILEKDLYPIMGSRQVELISAPELLLVLRRIEKRGAVDIAHRAKQVASLIFRYAIVTGRAKRDPSADLTGALQSRTKKHYAAITEPNELRLLLLAIDDFQGTFVVKSALELSPLLFQRPGEIRNMEWSEINWNESRWEIPGNKMKMGQDHIVPLSIQAESILKQLKPLSGRGKYVFPSARGLSRPISENAVRTALRTIGYSNEEMTPHGFRATARTILDEVLNFRVDYIEHQLAHAVKDPTGRAYNRTSFLPQRKKMMQQWSDYLDQLRK